MAGLVAAATCWIGWPCAADAGPASDDVQPFRAEYQGRRKIALIDATARARIELRRSAGFVLYTMDSTVTWTLLERKFRDCSVIRIDGERMLPLEYAHVDVSDPRKNVHTRFDWANDTAATTLGTSPEPVVVALAWPTWDPMSFQVALIALAQRRRPGDAELHRVIERGALKQHQVGFSGAVALAGAGGSVQVHEIVSRKAKGQVSLYLVPERPWRPYRLAFDDLTIELVGNSVGDPPASPLDGPVPTCSPAGPR